MAAVISVTSFAGFILCYWLAAYVLARGLNSKVSQRGFVLLLALGTWYLAAFVSLNEPVRHFALLSSGLIAIALMAWGDQIYHLMAVDDRVRFKRVHWIVLAAGVARLLVIVSRAQAPDTGIENAISYDSPWSGLSTGMADAFLAGLQCAAIAYYFWRSGNNYESGSHSRLAWTASLVPIGATLISSGVPDLFSRQTPGLLPELGYLAAVLMLAYMVATRQLLVERRTTFMDFVSAGLTIGALTTIYIFIAWRRGLDPVDIAAIAVLVVFSHSIYDLIRELTERLLRNREGQYKQLLRSLMGELVVDPSIFDASLSRGLDGLCHLLRASSGFVAVRDGDLFRVVASLGFVKAGTLLDRADVVCDDVRKPGGGAAGRMAWLAPAWSGELVGVVGLGPRHSLIEYVDADLDWLVDFSDWAGQMISIHEHPNPGYDNAARVALVDECLHGFTDYSQLGRSKLAEELRIQGATTIERGKALRDRLLSAIEALRPAGPMPKEPLPREWHGYAILHGAYVDDVPNRELMARLYISEGTFHRRRRDAVRAVTRTLGEQAR